MGILVTALGIAIFWYASGFPNTSGSYYGPAFVPQIIGIGLVICGVILTLRGLCAREAGSFGFSLDYPFDQPRAAPAIGLVLAAILAFVFLGEALGFQIITFATLLIAFIWTRGGLVFCASLALGLTVAFDLIFRVMLKVPVPSGPLIELIY
ncbi:tripartite tricarboxylate transporter TctB family protein [Halomonas sp. TRM85114]|uniref:tripartite tricarboxylate transporter TctB family protein n=1 Tax=Halomonas jincaotanensis TaxID=2810616 RepID=UPI001BD5C0BF|nr:tripartite tricarboxylate transporter TctB family protein [Halomonas jincaotanensis]MBS9404919.1 tripartite tricarboxylate transporter TctB family protein [Halomonas jincaotanensis]